MTGLLDESAKGIFVIAATPFAEDGALDLGATDQLVDFYLGCGVQGITILGVMGEATKMTAEEAAQFAAGVLARVDGRVPVIVGVSAPAIATVAVLTRQVMDLGAAGVMLQPLPGLKGDDSIWRYFEAVFAAIGDVPTVYQDYPQASGVHLPVPVWHRLVERFGQLVMLKHEDVPGLAKLSRIIDETKAEGRRRTSILIGNNGLYFPQELRRGADGAMTGFAFPDILVRVYELFVAGQDDVAEDLFDAYLPLNRYEQQPGFGLAVRKEILRRRGGLRCAAARYPAFTLGVREHSELDRLMARVEQRVRLGSL